jgi:hypothetical protein
MPPGPRWLGRGCWPTSPTTPTRRPTSGNGSFLQGDSGAGRGWQLYRDAAAVDPEVRADQQELSRLRRFTATGLLSGLPTTALRTGMTRDDAIDTLMVIMGPESYDLLVRQTGYSVDRFEQWTARTLVAALLEPDSG